jgi:hypothetical protein
MASTPDGAIALVRSYGGTWKDRYASDDKRFADAERLWTKFAHHAADRAEAEAGASPFILNGEAAKACVGEKPENDDNTAPADDEAHAAIPEPRIANPSMRTSSVA